MIGLGLIMVGGGLFSYVSMRKHVLSMLLSLEFMVGGIFVLMVSLISLSGGELFYFILFLSVVACSGALGLSAVVLLNRASGNDLLSVLILLEC